MDPVFPGTLIIAEAGVNHNGSVALALRLIEEAASAGADIVKFQSFRTDRLVTRQAPTSSYQRRNTGEVVPQHEMLRKLELDETAHKALFVHCESCSIEFLSTPFDADSASFLVRELGVRRLKVGSGDLTNGPLLLALARLARPIVLSTGMGTLAEVEQALGVLAFGYLASAEATPSRAAFEDAYASPVGQAALRENVSLLHCTTEYPAPPESVNLRAMDTLRVFGLRTGYSDHTEGWATPLAAVARGAAIIEKHFTLDRALPGPDHKASLEPAELKAMIAGIRVVERALGSTLKSPQAIERANMIVARKSLVAVRPIAAGEALNSGNVGVKRPGGGVSPMEYWTMLGRPASRDFAVDEAIET